MIHHTDLYKGIYMRGKFFIVLFLFLFTPRIAYSISKDNNAIWVYNNVSKTDLFGKHDSDIINALHEKYNKVNVNIDGKKLTVRNYSLKNKLICSVDYVELKKPSLSYYLSQTTVDMYTKLFKNEGRNFPEKISILTSLYPEHKCPAPYDEIIKINDGLVISEKYYVLFFKSVKDGFDTQDETTKKETWSTYCHEENPEKIYDGSSKEFCFFKGLDLVSSYDKLLKISDYSRDFLMKKIPIRNSSYKVNDKVIAYKWIGGRLNISVDMENEKINYSFNEKPSGVYVEVTSDTQY